MATYQKTGYDKALEFDPASGIIKYGQFEFFADQVGVKPTTQTFDFNTYKASVASQPIVLGQNSTSANLPDNILRQQFATDVQAGNVRMASRTPQEMLYGGSSAAYEIGPATVSTGAGNVPVAPNGNRFSNVQKKDPDTFSVTSYEIPSDIEFVNRLNAQAAQLATASAQGQVTDSSRPTPGNARLGKPNYSRAATVLAGEQAPLGGAKTTLGS